MTTTKPDDAVTDKQLAEHQPGQPLYGNENYATDHGRREAKTPPTRDEWLLEAKEIEAVLARGDHASPETIERLFLDAVPVVEANPPVARKKKEE